MIETGRKKKQENQKTKSQADLSSTEQNEDTSQEGIDSIKRKETVVAKEPVLEQDNKSNTEEVVEIKESKQVDNSEPKKKEKLDFGQKVKVLEESLIQQKDQFMRLAAEFDNYKKRQQQQTISHLKYAIESMAKDLFRVTDSLENALKHIEQEQENSKLEEFVTGIKLVQQQFLDVFKHHHIERFQDLGEVFNPERHEAIGTMETEDVEPNQVVDVLTPGYLLHDKVIRAAIVQVSKRKES